MRGNKTLTCGIYLLIKEGMIYIGASTKIEVRIRQHSKWKINFDYWILEECDKIILYERERFWINLFSKKGYQMLNKKMNKNVIIPKKHQL